MMLTLVVKMFEHTSKERTLIFSMHSADIRKNAKFIQLSFALLWRRKYLCEPNQDFDCEKPLLTNLFNIIFNQFGEGLRSMDKARAS
jgi:hypothetical protein